MWRIFCAAGLWTLVMTFDLLDDVSLNPSCGANALSGLCFQTQSPTDVQVSAAIKPYWASVHLTIDLSKSSTPPWLSGPRNQLLQKPMFSCFSPSWGSVNTTSRYPEVIYTNFLPNPWICIWICLSITLSILSGLYQHLWEICGTLAAKRSTMFTSRLSLCQSFCCWAGSVS